VFNGTQAGHFRLGLRAAWKATLNVKCPHCGEVHELSVRETYINGALKRPISLGHLGPR